MAKWLYPKPSGMSFTDCCIYVDNNIYSDNPDYETCFKYIWIIVVMLASKKRYFTDVKDYENFAFEVALEVYKRMLDPEKGRVKSVLNYVKSIISWRKMAFVNANTQEIIDSKFTSSWDPIKYSSNYIDMLESRNKTIILQSLEDFIEKLPIIVQKSVPKVYKSNKLVYNNIYKSALFTLLDRFTLTTDSVRALDEKLEDPTFNEAKFYRSHLNQDSIKLWHLDRQYESVVRIVVNKVNNLIVDEIKGVSSSLSITEEELGNILGNELGGGDAAND